MTVGRLSGTRTGHGDLDRSLCARTAANRDDRRPLERREGLSGNAIRRYPALAEAGVTADRSLDRHSGLLGDGDGRLSACLGRTVVQAAQPAQRGETPEFVAAARHLERVHIEGCELLAFVATLEGRCEVLAHQPTAPSICSSMRRLSSSAYSIGSSLAIGSTKPRTTMAIASSSVSPRLIR